ncbi:ShlB/FhaC/HecB family hemolysin secretion/activation protein [Antarcticimicrobium luteum]|uniref:ShlB/FhaC/HecB family hemolysin secretion/activation protein n=1 Tax=Antarcticimicrobium luteum TaxID=2547397 RepID=UPI00140AD158|nr:ShlB/FhaC/HecB family hemolysin secretion/activation protein [Antarcticimicrobium luteum]
MRRVAFAGASAYFSRAELDAATAPLLGHRLGPGGAQAIADAVNALYRAEGIDLAIAQVAGIDPGQGTVTIDLFEARLGRVDYRSGRTRPAYLRFRLGVEAGDLADTRVIAERLERLWLTDRLRANADFSPGAMPGRTNLTVSFDDPPPVTASLRFDNYGEIATGEARASASVRINSLTGWGDPLALDLMTSEGARSATLSYSRTLTPGGGQLAASVSGQRSETLSAPVVASETLSAGLIYAHPLILAADRSFWVSLGLDRYDETTRTAGVTTADQSGWALTLGANGARSFDRALRQVVWSVGLTAGRFTDRVLGLGDLSYGAVTASGRLQWALGDWGHAILMGAAQLPLTDDTPSRGKFAVTSPFAVPGYASGLSEGAGGYWTRFQVEAAKPLPISGTAIHPYAFVALGEAFDRAGGTWSGQGFASSVGIGQSGRIGRRGSFDVQLARSLTPVLGRGGDGSWSVRAAFSLAF